VLFFAGEATNPIRPSCVHGAIESGVRAAAEVQAALA
jgi:monoamine oxidase